MTGSPDGHGEEHEHESMDPFFLVSKFQAGGGGVMVWGISYWAP